MSGSSIRVLDVDFSRMISLKRIYFDMCGIEVIADGLLMPSGIEYISLNGNKIREIPLFIRNAKNLRNIELMSNRITTIPPWLDSLDNSSVLKVNILDNKIEQIPSFVGKYPERFEVDEKP